MAARHHNAGRAQNGGRGREHDPTSGEGPTVAAVGLRGVTNPSSLEFGTERSWQATMIEAGCDPCTMAQAAAHEAGHAVVAQALGASVTGARIFRSHAGGRVIWLGRNHYVPAGGFRAATATQDPGLVLRAAMHNLAGFAGECLAGLAHPSSSIDERVWAGLYCEAVANVEGVSKGDVVQRVGELCGALLLRNRQAFDSLRGHLFLRRRLTQDEATRMLASVEAAHDRLPSRAIAP